MLLLLLCDECGSVAEWLGRWTCDQQITSSTPGLSAIECNPGPGVVNTHVPLSPSSIICYQPMGGDAFNCGWEGNRMSGVALAMRHRQ